MHRHPILLGRLSEDGQWQQLNPEARFELPLVDLSGEAAAESEAPLASIIDEETSRSFDLVNGPLVHVPGSVRMSRAHHVVVWTAHHVVCDGWSIGLIVSELSKIYNGRKRGQQPDLQPSESFREYALASQETEGETGKSMAYWCEQFATVPPPLELPTDRSRQPVRTARASTVKRNIDATTHKSIKRAAGQLRATQVVLLMAGLKVLLHRLTGQSDLVVGLGAAGQALSGKNCLVGHCLNLLPVRTQLDTDASFQSNLAAVKKSVLDGYDHHHCTIGSILQHLKMPRSLSRAPLVEVLFNVDQDPGAVSFDGAEFSCERNPKQALHFDLFINVVEGPHGLCVECDYNTDLFDGSTIERWLEYYQVLLERVAANPSEALNKIPFLGPAEQRELITVRNDTRVDVPRETLLDWFERQSSKAPDARAVTFADEALTYGELNRRANQLARHLKAVGVGPEVLVGLLVERSLDMVVALLGVMKAGGAYVPLDPSFPHDRLVHMVEDSQMPLLVTHKGLEQALSTTPGNVVRLDSDWDEIAKQSGEPLDSPAPDPEALAYVLYTSGSTGKPKGVEIPHSALVNFLVSMRREPGFAPTDTLLAVTTLSFDIAGLEIYLPLISGGHVVIASREDALDPGRLIGLMDKFRCNVMQATPATWQALLDAGWRGSPELKLLCGGESFPRDLADKLLSRCRELWNMYGPTETTIWSTVHRVESGESAIPIGRPIANTQVFVLDVNRNLVPSGAVGELYIGGVGLARGYLRRPELTQERFVSSPFDAGQRLYRTGDMARWLPAGTLECLGRVDTQVKIRGFRIELGEIEAVLGRHAAVGKCVVVAREVGGDKRLVAYLQPADDSTPATAELRAHLKKALPDYMVPATFVLLEKLPLTPNGKIDRKALPAPDHQGVEEAGEHAAPADALELALTGIWSKVLKLPTVGVRDNFFELGGHSLAAVVLLSEIRKLTGKTLPLATLFKASTVAEFAALLREDGWSPSWSSLVPIQPAGSRRPLFLVHGAEGNVLLYRALTQYLGTDQPVYGLQSQGLNGAGHVDTSVPEMASKYIEDVMKIQPRGPYVLGGYCLGGVIALEMAQQLRGKGEDVELVLMLDTYNGSSISRTKARLLAPLHFVQNVWFHAINAISVPADDRRRFFRDKWSITITRMKMRVEAVSHLVRGDDTDGHSYPHLKVKRINDRAADNYLPRLYGGRVAIIRSKGHFAGLASPTLGWEGFVEGGLEIHELPVYPRGMLVDPFSKSLAAIMKGCLKSASSAASISKPNGAGCVAGCATHDGDASAERMRPYTNVPRKRRARCATSKPRPTPPDRNLREVSSPP